MTYFILQVELHTKGFFSSCPSTCIPIILSNVPIIESSQPPQIPTIGVQPSTSYPVPYLVNPMSPGIGINHMPMPQPSIYPDAPPPYSLHAPDSSSSSANVSSQESLSEIPSGSSKNEKPPLETTEM